MSDSAKKQAGYKTLRKRLKARERAIQRLKNRIAWLELQLTLHYVEDRRTQDRDETETLDAMGDDCPKCEQMRNMLDAPLQLPQIPELYTSKECSSDVLKELPAQDAAAELSMSRDGNDFLLTIDPSHFALALDQQDDTSKSCSEHPGFAGQEPSANLCCVFIVAVAILLVSWL